MKTSTIRNIVDIQHCFYINLEHRTDRKIHIEKQLATIGIEAERFNAIKMVNGAIGCSISHLKCLQTAHHNQWDHLLIVEDDIEFLDPVLFIKQMNLFLEKHHDWDVVLLAGNNMPPYKKIDDTCIQVQSCQTTTGYLVNGHYFEKLIKNIKTGISQLMRYPDRHREYAIDKYWFSLQSQDKWFLITPLTVVQREDYSDIEKKQTNYQHLMTDMDKEELFKAVRQYRMMQQKYTNK